MRAARLARDLFGNERPASAGSPALVLRLSLFDAAADRAALASGRGRSQERTEIVVPLLSDADERRYLVDDEAAWYCLCGAALASVDAPCGACDR